MNKELFDFLKTLSTEQRNSETVHLDRATPLEIVELISVQDRLVADRVYACREEIAHAIEKTANALAAGGRLIYAGAGTSGRIGVVDASECPPTFGTDPAMVVGLIAGGRAAMFAAQEGAEDSESSGASDLAGIEVSALDIVVGLAASGRTPYVWGALDEARKRGSITVLVCCVDRANLPDRVAPDLIIAVSTGPEVLMGSTRMKAGTAQKLVCNMISTGAMVRLGKVYENVMVDLKLTNAKLVERAIRILMMFTRTEYDASRQLLEAAGGHVKTALVMHRRGVSKDKAQSLLSAGNGFISAAVSNF